MKTKIQIKSIFGKFLFEFKKENNTIKDTLIEAIKQRANLSYAYLSGADLSGAKLSGVDLSWAKLSGTDLSWADLSGAKLSCAKLSGADLSGTKLSGANLSRADLSGTKLSRAYLKKIYPYFQIVPEEGSFVGWKKGKGNHLIKLEIPAEAKRHNYIGGRKCRAEFVKVLDIRDSRGYKVKSCFNGTHSDNILYEVGKIVKPDKYDPSPLNECSNGIHFFMTKQEAKDWGK